METQSTKSGTQKEKVKLVRLNIEEHWEKIDNQFTKAFRHLKKKELEDFNLEWGLWSWSYIPILRQACEQSHNTPLFVPLRYLYSYWHNRNELLKFHLQSRLGNIKEKKSLERSGILYRDLLAGRRTTADGHAVIKQVDDYLRKCKLEGNYEPITTAKVEEKSTTAEADPQDGEKDSS